MTRRDLLAASGSVMAAAALSPVTRAIQTPSADRKLRVVHMTDLHLRANNGAADGIALAVQKVLALDPRPDIVITGGDIVEGLMGGQWSTAQSRVNQLVEILKPLEMRVEHVLGNHDVIGWNRTKKATANEPKYGKAMFGEVFAKGPTYRSFDLKGWHFVVLDSIQFDANESRTYTTKIDDTQLTWLKNDLAKLTPGTPVLVATHVPLLSGFLSLDGNPYGPWAGKMLITNAKEVNEILLTANVRAVVQGHTHIVENLVYAGRQHITSGAVCGNWWQGKRYGIDPEGYSILDLDGDTVKWQYAPTGWVVQPG